MYRLNRLSQLSKRLLLSLLLLSQRLKRLLSPLPNQPLKRLPNQPLSLLPSQRQNLLLKPLPSLHRLSLLPKLRLPLLLQ